MSKKIPELDLKQALCSPSSIFVDPAEVVDEGTLSELQEIKILRSWEYDARELLAAIEENWRQRWIRICSIALLMHYIESVFVAISRTHRRQNMAVS
jgi:hypothetical protein